MCTCALEALLIAQIPNGVLALLIVCLGMCVTGFLPTMCMHVQCYIDSGHVQYIEGHLHIFSEQTILHHYVGSTSALTSVNSSTEEL